VIVFAAEEDPLPRNETVLENDIGVGVPDVDAAFDVFALVLVVNGNDLLDPFIIGRNRKGHSVIFFIGTQGAGGHYHDFIRDRRLGDVEFATPDNNAVAFLLDDVDVHVRVRLFRGSFQALAFHVGLGAASHKVFLLETFEPFEEILVVLRIAVVHLIGLERSGVDGIQGIGPHASLNTHPCLPA